MPQAYCIGNGNLLANFDGHLHMRDIYFPYVGLENHSAFGKVHRIGIWIDGAFSWLYDDGWEFDIDYEKDTLVGDSTAKNEALEIELHFQDFVYTSHNILFRNVTVHNLSSKNREIRLYFAHDFYLYGEKMQDTAQFEPELKGILHYRQRRYFLVSGQWDHNDKGLSEFSVGKSGYQDKEGTWKDAEDGHLHGNPIEQGSVDSVIGFYETFSANQKKTLHFWVCAGKCYGDIEKNMDRIAELGPNRIYNHTCDYWKEWSTKYQPNLESLPKKAQELWRRSLLTIRSQTDNRGAIIASNDSDIMKFNKDTYTYMWPRDGALVSMILSRTQYFEVVKEFIHFCEQIVTEDGYVLHKFFPDTALGSSWHPKYKNGKAQLPIQEDESALILVAMWEFYEQSKSIETVQEVFNSMVLKIGRFLVEYVDKNNLPKPSYDPWEELYGVFSYTTATTYAGLEAAANLSKVTGHYEDEKVFREAAVKIREAMLKYLFSKTHNRFVKRLMVDKHGNYDEDPTVDASLAFVWEMGVLPPHDPRVASTMKAIEEQLIVRTKTGGIARYTGDCYHRNWEKTYSADVPGNPWIITTLWLANWYIATAKNKNDLKKPLDIINWTVNQANSAGILPEQMDPWSGEPLSVGPLTWSHATYVDTVLRYARRMHEFDHGNEAPALNIPEALRSIKHTPDR